MSVACVEHSLTSTYHHTNINPPHTNKNTYPPFPTRFFFHTEVDWDASLTNICRRQPPHLEANHSLLAAHTPLWRGDFLEYKASARSASQPLVGAFSQSDPTHSILEVALPTSRGNVPRRQAASPAAKVSHQPKVGTAGVNAFEAQRRRVRVFTRDSV